ncbi:MAG TPA: transcription termination/antitermination protein NusA [Clostridiales bacterium]|nr:transcription termination/antitermination protein NusA [Clostridiales bacterium]
MSVELIYALEQLEKEKGIHKDILIEAMETALISAYRKNFHEAQNVEVSIDRETGDVRVYALMEIVTGVEDPQSQILEEESKLRDSRLKAGDVLRQEVTPRNFGRIAAQTAKQVVLQKIREAERGMIYDEYIQKEGDIVTGIIQRFEKNNMIVDLPRTEGILPVGEQVPGENYRVGDRLKSYLVEVKKTSKGPQIVLSRTHPGLVRRLFELEVPEIHHGVVEIKGIAREAGSRTKISVFSRDQDVDPVGACVGQRGTRVQSVVDELRGEKIDIIKWSGIPEEMISSSLSPAKVIRVTVNEEDKTARVVVPDFQLSLAIGGGGQNARLAARLTGWKIDIKKESDVLAEISQGLLNFNKDFVPDNGPFLDDYQLSVLSRKQDKADEEADVEKDEEEPAGTVDAPDTSDE